MGRRTLLCLNHLGGSELDYVHEAFDGNWVVPLGPNVDGFEKDLKEWLCAGRAELEQKQVVALSAGTAAVHLALAACGVGPGDEVVAQSFTFAASINPIAYLGAKPVLVDSEPDTWNMDPHLLDLAIRCRKAATGRKPKAVVAVHLYGMPAKLAEIQAVCDSHGIPLVEDAAEALGSNYRGQACGTWGRYGVLSFNGNKMITTSGGGALVCPDKAARDLVMHLATQAREPFPYYQHERIGYNYRLSNISAAIGQGQMRVLGEHIAHHRRIAAVYAEAFAGHPLLRYHSNPGPDFESNYWLSTVLISPEAHVRGQENANSATTGCQPNANIEAARQAFAAQGIETRPLWKPMHKQPICKGLPAYINGVSESLFKQGLCLPSGPYVDLDEAKEIADILIKMIE